MQYKDEELKLLQKDEIEIVSEVIRICKDNGLSYFTVGGTTLGAVRHSGFIPWDDDIDIGLYRDDYEKFLKIAPKELNHGYFLQHYLIDAKTPTYHAKVMKSGTQFVEEYAENIDIEHGIFVDIMPYDNIPSDLRLLKRYRRKVKLFHQLFVAKSVRKTSLTRGKKKILYTAVRTILHLLMVPVSKEYLFSRLEVEMRKYNSIETEEMSSRGLAVFECKKSDVFPTISHVFEELELQIPRNYDKILTQQYGDYMTLPPVEQRVGHAPIVLKV